jgi:hypothetical protein
MASMTSRSGIDLLISRGPALETVLLAIEGVCQRCGMYRSSTSRHAQRFTPMFANALNCSIAWPDERTFATTAFIICAPDGKIEAVMIYDASDAACGFAVIQREDS